MDGYPGPDAASEAIFQAMVGNKAAWRPVLISPHSRAFILDRVKVALDVRAEQNRAERCLEEWRSLPRDYSRSGTLNDLDRLSLFEERVRHYNGTTYRSGGDIQSDIAGILAGRNKRILIIPASFPASWLPDGFMFIPDENLSKDQLASNDGAVTCCTLAIAITGTIVLDGSPDQGRRATTLLPDYHLCILRQQDIVEVVPEAVKRLEPVKHRPLTFFSGPSATVDIEMTRVRGVHGPRTVDILIV